MSPAHSTPLPVILIVEDDDGHAILIRQNLEESGLANPMLHLRNGQEALDFLYRRHADPRANRDPDKSYLLLLDIRMPKIDGIEVLRQVKGDPELRSLPVIMLTTTDDSREVEKCYGLGCSAYLRKPLNYEKFIAAIRCLGLFIGVIQIPSPQP
ncbi:Response regulator receiver domain-containing protein [Verrucomicrobium sp. GAS474]|uniref:response regulator n=1 Tax=Verrucomicrobium sp. GAS474 TaxID=1882831 RepID=UPI00087D9DC6|nr:response regulator [Verrucomicrobium sp. GAS474]SDU21047.1 Response regulator receiver domain-containing protein [Verrucomicrobium sp. GAS474]